MARSVVEGLPATYSPLISLHGLPCLSADALQLYSELLPRRLQKFPQPLKNQAPYFVMIPKDMDRDREKLRSLPWTQELYHDGESVFWLLVWWAVHLRPFSPSPTRSSPSKIYSYIFRCLTNIDPATGMDAREWFLQELVKGRSWLDPKYQELEPLFRQMAIQLRGDLYWAETVEMKDPEFLHEALQRIIFNFLVKNREEPFMKLKKHPSKRREVEYEIRRHAVGQITRTDSTMVWSSESEGSKVSHLSLTIPLHTPYSCWCRRAPWSRSLDEFES